MPVVSRLAGTTIDCPDPGRLAAFYQALTGWEKTYDEAEFAAVEPRGGGPGLIFQRVESYTAPAWPDPARPQQFHLDFVAEGDLDRAEAAAVGLGATLAEHQPKPERWRVMLDPVGHPFCLCVG
ncbi:VOC family protein [Actinocrinis puniceicyclus]|uniref:VOC family protein n=1 Tax=Actinocrinis puniceicyclus TaxID=977794 RepID=A0A8J8BD95_9ACTN|nr:VOC family protein [Actinocrinis puniceicyclus]MBS2964360.1 VOC family protein [Actinocrinis puniceicyclus]